MSKPKRSFDRNWNEFNTFTKLIFPYLEETLNYPARTSKYFDEQTWVRKRGDTKGPYDGAFKDENGGVVVLIEAKKESKSLTEADVQQAFDYCLGDDFTVPPPYVLVSNGKDNRWFRRNRKSGDVYGYSSVDAVDWKKAREEAGSGEFLEQLSLKKIIKVLSQTRNLIFNDLALTYFPDSFKMADSKLGSCLDGFEKVLKTRKSFVDATLVDAEEDSAVRHVLSSIALSLTLKVLFLKILTEKKSEAFPSDLKKTILELSKQFPGILKAAPYDVLEFTDDAQEKIVNMYASMGVMGALLFQGSENPIGDVWDGLVESEFDDLQVKSLGNVYTPNLIVKTMVESAESALGGWIGKNVLEPACGSGHFVREVYKRIRDSYLNERKMVRTDPSVAHKKALAHLRAIDIDPFAVQTTQLGMFLELYRQSDVWSKLAPKDNFDFSSVVTRADFLEVGMFEAFGDFSADLIIGNPPYGIDVTSEVAKRFELVSNDSYGCFIVRALEGLRQGGHLVFIVSNTFLMTKSHTSLRKKIFSESSVKKIFNLHRNAFPRDVFCCLLQLEKSKIEAGTYTYYDAWSIHPKDPEFQAALSYFHNERPSLPSERFAEYQIPTELSLLRCFPQKLKKEPKTKEKASLVLNKREFVYPILTGQPSLALYCSDLPLKSRIAKGLAIFPVVGNVDCLQVQRDKIQIPVVKLWQLATVLQGLATADDELFLRKSSWVVANARRRNLKDVNESCAISEEEVKGLTESQKKNGIHVVDPAQDKYFVPFDKGGEQDTEAGEFRNFWTPVDYWIDWSEGSVAELKKRNLYPVKTAKKPRYQNSQYYFKRGIICSVTGLYAPTYQLSFGGIFGHKANLILPFKEEITEYLLVVLSSRLMRYFAKAFICNTVDFSTDYFKHLPVVVPTNEQFVQSREIFNAAVALKKNAKPGEEITKQVEGLVEPFVAKLYGLSDLDTQEISLWFKRRYPHFGRSKEERQAARSSPTKKAP